MHIRIANAEDLKTIVDIYNQAVDMSFTTADTEHWVAADKQEWYVMHTANDYPLYVAEIDGIIAGWLSVSPYRPGRKALIYTKELSYYVDQAYRRQGVGTQLMAYAMSQAKQLQVRTYFAILLDTNAASIQLLTKFGFSQWGHLPGVAIFDGKACGHLYYGLSLPA